MKSIVVLLTFTLASCASLPPKRSSRRAAPPQNATRAPLARVAAACRRKPAAWWARLVLWCAVARDPGAAVWADEWTALRLPDAALVAREGAGALRTLRRRRRAGRVTRLAGVGY